METIETKPGNDPSQSAASRNLFYPYNYHAPNFYRIFCHTLVN